MLGDIYAKANYKIVSLAVTFHEPQERKTKAADIDYSFAFTDSIIMGFTEIQDW